MEKSNRRKFVHDVATGMLIAGAGSIVYDLGIARADNADRPDSVSLGRYESLADLFLSTSLDKLQPAVVAKLKKGDITLEDVTAAAALMNARTFGGQNYVGYHCEMALSPALEMSSELPTERQPLPVLKVLHRTCANIQNEGANRRHALKPVSLSSNASMEPTADALREATRRKNPRQAEQIFVGLSNAKTDEVFNQMQPMALDYPNVHRIVLTHRCWQLTKLVGDEHASTILRQCVRFCVKQESEIDRPDRNLQSLRDIYPKAIDQHGLMSRKLGATVPDDTWIGEFSDLIFQSTHDEAVDATAAALAEGIEPDSVAEALCLAANQLMLRHDKDRWRGRHVHGNSTGLHAADAMNAYRHIALQCDHQHTVMSLLVGSHYVAGSGRFQGSEPYPHANHLQDVRATDQTSLLGALDEAIRGNDQARAAAIAHRFGELGLDQRSIFNQLLRFAVSEDGKLHNEKYYRTATSEFVRTRPAFRWRHVISLARVMASSYGLDATDRRGHRAPGYHQACELLNVPV